MKPIKTGVKGIFKAEVLKNGKVVRDYGWQDNMVLDTFFKHYLTAAQLYTNTNAKMRVGTGTTPPQPTDVNLEAPAGSTVSATSFWDSFTYTTDYLQVTSTAVFNTSEGALNGNYSEFVVYMAVHSGTGSSGADTNCMHRALFKDQAGQPTTITVNSDETLRITHKLIIQVQWRADLGTFEMDSVTYSMWLRPTQYQRDGSGDKGALSNRGLASNFRSYAGSNRVVNGGFSGDLPDLQLDGWPQSSGTRRDFTAQHVLGASLDPLENTCTITIPASVTIFNNDLRGVGIMNASTAFFAAQTCLIFDPPIPKNSQNKFVFTVKMAFVRL